LFQVVFVLLTFAKIKKYTRLSSNYQKKCIFATKVLIETKMKIRTLILCALLAVPGLAQAQSSEISNEVINTIMARRSIRKYLDKPVEQEKLEAVVKCGINAPSGMNAQPWQVRVVTDKSYIEETTKIYVKANPQAAQRDPNFKNMYRNAPVIICVGTPRGQGTIDSGLLGENMALAAQSLGLGTCFLGGPVRFLVSNEECKPYIDRLDFPEGYALSYILAIGYPDESPEAKPRDTSKARFVK